MTRSPSSLTPWVRARATTSRMASVKMALASGTSRYSPQLTRVRHPMALMADMKTNFVQRTWAMLSAHFHGYAGGGKGLGNFLNTGRHFTVQFSQHDTAELAVLGDYPWGFNGRGKPGGSPHEVRKAHLSPEPALRRLYRFAGT